MTTNESLTKERMDRIDARFDRLYTQNREDLSTDELEDLRY